MKFTIFAGLFLVALVGRAAAAPQFFNGGFSESDSSFNDRDIVEKDDRREEFLPGGGFVEERDKVFKEHDASGATHQERFGGGGIFGGGGFSEKDSSLDTRDIVQTEEDYLERDANGDVFYDEQHSFKEQDKHSSSHQESFNGGGFFG